MSDTSKIQWTDSSWNPVVGCDKVSPGCKNCYAIRDAHRLAGNPNPKVSDKYRGLTKSAQQWSGIGARFWEAALAIPLHWKKPRRVFVNSQSDLFHETLTDDEIAAVFGVMAACKRHTFQILTKRPERMLEWFSQFRPDRFPPQVECSMSADRILERRLRPVMRAIDGLVSPCDPWPLPNVWLGVSAENQAAADERIPLLLQTPAAVRFVSCEPLLGAVNLSDIRHGNDPDLPVYPDWVICGGESGPNARPMHPEWARSLRDQCEAARVPFFFKQWGAWAPYFGTWEPHFDGDHIPVRVGKHAAGRELDGRTWDEFPEVRSEK